LNEICILSIDAKKSVGCSYDKDSIYILFL
jgi:hypothetical protein